MKKPRRKIRLDTVAVEDDLPLDLYFLRKHTHALLRRYYYASMMMSRIASSIGIRAMPLERSIQ